MAQVQADLHLRSLLLVGVVRFGGRRRVVADAVEARYAAAIENETAVERPKTLAQAAALILGIEFTLDPLLDPGDDRPLFVFRGISIHTPVHAKAEIGVVEHIGRDDAIDLVILVRMHPRRNETQRRAAVRIDADQGDRNEWSGRRVEPPPETRGRSGGGGGGARGGGGRR